MRKHKRKLSEKYGAAIDQYYINYVHVFVDRMEARIQERLLIDDAQSKAAELHAKATDLLNQIDNG
jgi:hypothetical protein